MSIKEIESEIAKLLQEYRINKLKEKGVTDFTNVDKVIVTICSYVKHPLVREGYLQAVSSDYPGIQAYKDILKYASYDRSKRGDYNLAHAYITTNEFLFIKPSMMKMEYAPEDALSLGDIFGFSVKEYVPKDTHTTLADMWKFSRKYGSPIHSHFSQ